VQTHPVLQRAQSSMHACRSQLQDPCATYRVHTRPDSCYLQAQL